MCTFKGTSGKSGDIDGGTRGERTACDSQSTLQIWGPGLSSLTGLMSFVEVVANTPEHYFTGAGETKPPRGFVLYICVVVFT